MLAQPNNGGAEGLRKEIQKFKALSDKPFGVNITLLPVGHRRAHRTCFLEELFCAELRSGDCRFAGRCFFVSANMRASAIAQ